MKGGLLLTGDLFLTARCSLEYASQDRSAVFNRSAKQSTDVEKQEEEIHSMLQHLKVERRGLVIPQVQLGCEVWVLIEGQRYPSLRSLRLS